MTGLPVSNKLNTFPLDLEDATIIIKEGENEKATEQGLDSP